jgi:hypothetical protein
MRRVPDASSDPAVVAFPAAVSVTWFAACEPALVVYPMIYKKYSTEPCTPCKEVANRNGAAALEQDLAGISAGVYENGLRRCISRKRGDGRCESFVFARRCRS